jgi:beta-lactamase regulating signal transducer with metallopeptidase domain
MNTLLEIGLANAVTAAALAVVAAGIGFFCRRPALTHGLWVLVLLKLITPPLFPVPISWPGSTAENDPSNPPASAAEPPEPFPGPADDEGGEAAPPNDFPPGPPAPGPEDADDGEPAPEGGVPAGADADAAPGANPGPPDQPSWPAIVGLVWGAGSLFWFGWLFLHIGRFQRLVRFARPAPARLQNLVAELARRMGVKRCPALGLVPGAVSPMLWGIGRAPRLLFPARLLERLDREQQTTLLVHELAHLRRRDHWIRLLELAVLCLYWWNPVVWWARRELREAEEQCCDAWVVWAQGGEGRAYALALLQTVAFFSHAPSVLPAAASGIGQVAHLRRRLVMIMQGKTPRSLSGLGGAAVLGLGLVLPLTPVLAQAPRGGRDDRRPERKMTRQEQIEILKKAVQILEEQERADRGKKEPARKRASEAEIKKARDLAQKLAQEVRAKRRELQKAEENLRKALQNLSKLTGRNFGGFGGGMGGGGGMRGGRGFGGGGMGGFGPPGFGPGGPMGPGQGRNPFGPPGMQPGGGQPGQRGPQGGASDLEKKLDRLLKEVEELKRELRQRRAPDTRRGRGRFGRQGGGYGPPRDGRRDDTRRESADKAPPGSRRENAPPRDRGGDKPAPKKERPPARR